MSNYQLRASAKQIPKISLSWKTSIQLDDSLAGTALQVSHCPVPGCLGWGNILRHRNAFHRTEEACPVAAHMRKRRQSYAAPHSPAHFPARFPAKPPAHLPAHFPAQPPAHLPAHTTEVVQKLPKEEPQEEQQEQIVQEQIVQEQQHQEQHHQEQQHQEQQHHEQGTQVNRSVSYVTTFPPAGQPYSTIFEYIY